MKITKYPQSCFLIENKGQRFIIDPGNMVKTHMPEFNINDWQNITAILITHKHSDHQDTELIKEIQSLNPNVLVYTNSEVANILKEKNIETQTVTNGNTLKFGEIKIETTPSQHGYVYWMGETGYPQENVGYIIDDGEHRLYHTSDTIMFKHDLKADIVLVPMCGGAVVMEPQVAVWFVKSMDAKLAIPCHYDNPKFRTDTKEFEEFAKKENLSYKILNYGETLEI